MDERVSEEKLDRQFIVTAGHSVLKQSLAIRLRCRMTPSERSLWQHLRANRLGGLHFRRQQIIAGFIADFFCDAARLVIELDGPIHDDQVEYDAERDQIIEAYGLCVLRITNAELRADLNAVRRRILAEARRIDPLLILSPAQARILSPAQAPTLPSEGSDPLPGASADPPLGRKGG